MCGITGIYALKATAASRLAQVLPSMDQLRQRGPDAGGHFKNDRIALGHRRLSIIDTSEAAGQPMEDSSGRYRIVFNGEIFNYRELYEKYLSEKGLQLRTGSDTEVLLCLLIEYGPECLGWLNGFFSLCLYDMQEEQMLLARDRYGKKPLLYHASDSYFAFASELKALIAYGIPKEINYSALYHYLQLNYVPQPATMLQDVFRLNPGHYMYVGPGGIKAYKAYYTLRITESHAPVYSYEEAQKKLIELMDNAVRERLIADVPLGAFLSGGIDSSVVVALASRYSKHMHTFSVGYKDNAFFDETSYARLVADRYKTDHTVFSLSSDDFLEHVHDVLEYLDEPFGDSSAIPVYILSKYTRQHVTVALSGDGGDEVFAGYNKHMAEWRVRRKSMLNQLVSGAAPVLNILPKSRNNPLTNKIRQLHRFASGAGMSPADRYWRWASYLTGDEAMGLLTGLSASRVDKQEASEARKMILSGLQSDDFNEVLLTDMNLVLLSDMLVKVDMMSMANSLEVRSPFLDHHVVDFAFGLPASFKIDGSMKKKILQDAFRKMLPEEIYNRPKHGFEIPLLGWFRKELWNLIDQDLLENNFVQSQGIFSVEAVKALKKKLQSKDPGDSHATIWALIVFQHWWKRYIAS